MKNNLTYDITIEDTKVSDTCMSGLESEEKLMEDVAASDMVIKEATIPDSEAQLGLGSGTVVWGKRTISERAGAGPTVNLTEILEKLVHNDLGAKKLLDDLSTEDKKPESGTEIKLEEKLITTKDWLKNFPMRINLGDGFFGIAKIVKSEDNIPTIEIEVEKTPTLKEIVEKTEGFTLIEREPGLIYRKFDDESYEDSEGGRILNSKLICRVRYLLKQIKEKLLLCKTQDEIHELIHNELCKAYDEYPLIKEDSGFLHSISENLTPFEPFVTYDIGLNTDPGPIVVMDIKIETDKFQMK